MRISRQHLVAGMELAADVQDHQGRQLLSAGTVLTPREISAFEVWSIAAVDVIDADASTSAMAGFSLASPISASEEARVQHRFKHLALRHPAEKALLAASLTRAAANSNEQTCGMPEAAPGRAKSRTGPGTDESGRQNSE